MAKYIFSAIFATLLAFVVYATIEKINQKPLSSKRLVCHKSAATFEKIADSANIKKLQAGLKSGDFTLKVIPLPSKYMPTKLFSKLNTEDIEKEFISLFKSKKTDANSNVSVKIFVYENDKLDPKKKTKKSKLYEGYLLFHFFIDKKPIYKVQLDFYEENGKDIPQLLKCAKESVLSL